MISYIDYVFIVSIEFQTQQFTQSVIDAKNKMNMLVNPSDEVVKLVTNLYNTDSTTAPTNLSSNSNAYPVSANLNSMNNNANSVFGRGSSSLFNSSSQTTNLNPFARSTSSGFGSMQSQNTSNLFGSSAMSSNNLFGSSNANTTTSVFSSPSSFSNTSNSNSIFGGANQQSNSLFGQNSTQQQSTPLFNSNMQTQSSSIFGSSAATPNSFGQPAAPSNATPFALPQIGSSSTQSTNIFGGKTQQNPIFGGNATFGGPIKTGLFAQTNTPFNQNTNSGNIFGQTAQSQEQQPQGFGSEPSTASVFGGSQNVS